MGDEYMTLRTYVSILTASGHGGEMQYTVTVERAEYPRYMPPRLTDLPPDVKAALLAWLQQEDPS